MPEAAFLLPLWFFLLLLGASFTPGVGCFTLAMLDLDTVPYTAMAVFTSVILGTWSTSGTEQNRALPICNGHIWPLKQ